MSTHLAYRTKNYVWEYCIATKEVRRFFDHYARPELRYVPIRITNSWWKCLLFGAPKYENTFVKTFEPDEKREADEAMRAFQEKMTTTKSQSHEVRG